MIKIYKKTFKKPIFLQVYFIGGMDLFKIDRSKNHNIKSKKNLATVIV
jgi:hypothetical protein